MTLDTSEERAARGALPQNDIELLRIVEDIFVVRLRRESSIEVTYNGQNQSA